MTFDADTLLFSSLSILCGYEAAVFGALTKGHAVGAGLLPPDRYTRRLLKLRNLEYGIIAGVLAILIGSIIASFFY